MDRTWTLARLSVWLAGAAIVFAGCGDEETVFVERPLFEDPPAAAQGFLGFDEASQKLTVCGNCHVGQQAQWEQTRHADAWHTLEASGHSQALCEDCHATGPLGNATSGEVGYAGSKDTRYHDVQCEACHGPGMAHVTNPDDEPSRPLASIAVAYDTLTSMGTNCAECHSGTHHPFVEEWSQSKHARVNPTVMARLASDPVGSASCTSCHTGQGALSAWGVRAEYIEKDFPSTQHSGITCGVCHDPHGSPYESQLRYSISIPDENQNLCMKCHNRRAEPELSAASLRGPHAPEGPLLLGQAGWWPPNFEPEIDRIVATHGTTGNPRLCASCHVSSFEVTDEATGAFVFNATGHLFEAIPCLDEAGKPVPGSDCDIQSRTFLACTAAGCHGTEESARAAFATARVRIANLVEETDRLVVLSEDHDNNDGVFTVADGAWFNARLGELPGSSTHNPFLSEQLLVASIQALEDTYGISAARSVSLSRVLR